ncbi:MAG: DUF4082 domain-containing protein [Actinomycetes bacterium]
MSVLRRNLAALLAVALVITLGLAGSPTARAQEPLAPTAVAYAPDGRTIAVGTASGSVSLYDAGTGRVVSTLTGHADAPITAVQFSPDGSLLASGGRDSTVRLWPTRGGSQVRVLHAQEQAVRALAFSPDGSQLLAGGEDTRAMLWDVGSGALTQVFPGASDFVTAVAFSPDGRAIAVASRDARITLLARSGQATGTLRGHTGEITSLAFAPDSRTLASSSADETVRLWDVDAGVQRASLDGHVGPVAAVAFSPDGATLTSGGRDGSLRVWDAASGNQRRADTESAPVVSLAVSPDGKTSVEARANGTVRGRETATGRSTRTFSLASAGTSPVATEPFTAEAADAALGTGQGGPVLVVTSGTDPFSAYYAEILRAEGLTSFATQDMGAVTAGVLADHEVVVLAATPTSAQVTLFADWVNAGGNLIAMRPDSQLAGLLGLVPAGGTLSEGYLRVDTSTRPGSGIVGETMQFHGTADRYTLNGARAVATLYSGANTATNHPAVTLHSVGSAGGQAAAFTFDLARSVILTRQGNPAWAGQERDGIAPIRSDDHFYGAADGDPKPDWVDLDKVAIPQADEQQRLLVNLLTEMNADRTPLPRFWYLPRGEKAAIVMTGDDHGNGGTKARFDQFLAESPAGCSVADWECVRGTSYIYPATPLTNAEAVAYANQGFEVGVHVTTSCRDWTAESLAADYTRDLQAFASKYTGLAAPTTNRTHCIAWSEWSTQASVEHSRGIRLDTNFYYWPPSWLQDRAGFFTGSGFPMRFTDPAGHMIDVYQATTQLTDESGQSYPTTVENLLDRALGPEGYYGAFTINAHTDAGQIAEATTTIAAAKARGVPVVTAKQMLDWLDGRNSSAFQGLTWDAGRLSFTVAPGAGARNLDMMLPASSGSNRLVSVTRDGSAVPFTHQTIKGLDYAFVRADAGAFVATYAPDTVAPFVTAVDPADAATGISQSASASATFSEALDPATVSGETVSLRGPNDTIVPATVTYDAAARTVRLTPSASLAPGTQYRAAVRGGAAAPSVRDAAGNPLAADHVWSFSTAVGPVCPCTIWPSTAEPVNKTEQDPNPVELGVKFRSDLDGFITGVRFWKGTANAGTHVGSLWTASGQRLANATFINETATGWQQVTFNTPVAISANTTYVASYHTPSGMYAADVGYFSTGGVDNPPLHALASSSSGGNGVYAYSSVPAFPASTWQGANYWVDAVFTASLGPDTTAPQVVQVSPADQATAVATDADVTAVFNEPLDPASVSSATVTLTGSGSDPVSSAVSYASSTRSVVIRPTAPLAPQTSYTARLAGGSSSPRITDVAGNALASDRIWTFTTGDAGACDSAPNPIVAENCRSGSPASEWDVSGAGDPSIQGFSTDISVNRGATVDFKIDTTAATYDVLIYRLGYYGGAGARLVHTIPGVSGTRQPACTTSPITMGGGATTDGELLDCGNWSVSASWAVPSGATSGVYLARPTRPDGGASHIPFVVRNDASNADIVFQTSDTTWQSYNTYGGYNAYGSSGATMAEKLSYNRPFTTRGAELENYLFNAEYPMIRWLERNGYDVSYISAVDAERNASLLANHDAYLSVGHDEYWSQGRRDAVTAARDAGVHLAFLSGNEVYWKTRWEDSARGEAGTNAYRTQVVYKEGNSAPNTVEHRNCYDNFACDPSDVWTGQWRQAPGATPENSLSAQISWRENTASITVPAAHAQLRFWRDTAVAALGSEGTVTLPSGTLGYEWDPWQPQYAEHYPAGRVRLSTTVIGSEEHHLALYRAPSGALVFGAGTVQWSWGLDSNHDRGSAPESVTMQQATANLFADMNALPATLQSGLIMPTPSTDTLAPTSTITAPTAGDGIPVGGEVTVSGTATDAGGGRIGGVEVSTDGGQRWQRAVGGESWVHSFTPTTEGSLTIMSRAVDDSGRLETPSAGVTVTVGTAPVVCPCTIWPSTAVPQRTDSDRNATEVGVKFRASENGAITGIRFHKATANTGTHVGTLWTGTGTKLASATFTNETASGWQQVTFATPVPITAGTTYIASYHAPAGRYSVSSRYFADAATTRGPLTALRDGTDGGNGVYRYTSTPSQSVPTTTYQSENYWVDVVFTTSG